MLTFENIIKNLKDFWQKNGCLLLEGYDQNVGAGTLAPYTAFHVLGKQEWNICQVQYCRRPTDGRFAQNPNRLGGYFQMQIILKPAPDDIQQLCIDSLESIGIKTKEHDIRFVEDDWQNPSIGASGLGYEVWCDGMEVTQFTYMQKIGGIECDIIAGEITYGLERLAMYVQNKDSIFDIVWSDYNGKITKYSDVLSQKGEHDICAYYQLHNSDTEYLRNAFNHCEKQSLELIAQNLVIPAYEFCLQASHTLNILDARRELSQNERKEMIFRVRELAKSCFERAIIEI